MKYYLFLIISIGLQINAMDEFGPFVGANSRDANQKIIFECKDGALAIRDENEQTHELFRQKSEVIKAFYSDGCPLSFTFDDDAQRYHLPLISKHDIYPVWLLLNYYPKRIKLTGKKKKQLKKEALQNYEKFESTLSIDQEIDLLNVADYLNMPIVEKMISHYLSKKFAKNESSQIALDRLNSHSMERFAKKFIEKCIENKGIAQRIIERKCKDVTRSQVFGSKIVFSNPNITYLMMHDLVNQKSAYHTIGNRDMAFNAFGKDYFTLTSKDEVILKKWDQNISIGEFQPGLECEIRLITQFHPKKRNLLIISGDKLFKIYHLKKKKQVISYSGEQPVWHPKEKTIAYADSNKIYIHKLESVRSFFGQKNYRFEFAISLEHNSAQKIKKIAWNPVYTDRLAACDDLDRVAVWFTQETTQPIFKAKKSIDAIDWRQCGKLLAIKLPDQLKIIDLHAQEIASVETSGPINRFLWVPGDAPQIVYTAKDTTMIWNYNTNSSRKIFDSPLRLFKFSNNTIAALDKQSDGHIALAHVTPHLLDMKLSKEEYELLIKAYIVRKEGLKLYLEKNKELRTIFDGSTSTFKEILQTYWNLKR